MQAGRRLVQDVEGAAGAPAGQLLGQLDPLRLAAGQRRGRLSHRDVAESDVLQRPQLARDRRHVLEQGQGLIDGQLQDIGDGRSPISDLQRLPVVAAPLALLAGDIDVGQEVHLDGLDPASLAGLAASALDVEREPPRPVTAGARLGQHREQLPDDREKSGVGGRVRPGRPADGRLVDLDDLVHQIGALDAPVGAGRRRGAIKIAGEGAVQDAVDEGRLPRAAHAGDRGEQPERNGGVDILEIVGPRPPDDERPPERRTAGGRNRNAALSPQVASGHRWVPVRQELRRRPLEYHLAAVHPRARPEIDHVVGGPDRLFVVFDDYHGIPEIAQAPQRRQQPPVVPLMQADGRLIEHVQHAGQVGADLGGEPYPLPLAPGQGGRAPRQRQVSDADVGEKPQPVANLAKHAAGNQLLPLRQLDGRQRLVRLPQRQPGVLGDGVSLHAHRPAPGPETLPVAGGTSLQGTKRLEALLLGPGSRLVASPQVRQNPLEVAPERLAPPAAAPVPLLLGSRRGGRPLQQGLALPARQPVERRIEIDAEMPAQPRERLPDQLGVALGPRGDRALVQGLRAVRHDAHRVEVVDGPEALTEGAGALRRVEREHPRRDLGHAHAALHARQSPGEQPVAPLQGVDDHDVVGQAQRELDAVPQPALHPGSNDQPVDEDRDIVVSTAFELEVLFESPYPSIDPDLHEPLGPQGGEVLLELALAAAHDRGQHVDALVGGTAQHHLDDAVDRLRRNRPVTLRTVRHADVGEQQAQVVVDLGDGADGGTGVRPGGLLLDGNRGGETVDQVDVRFLDLLEKLAGIGRQRFHVTPLPFGIDRVEGQRRLARPGQAGHHDETVARQTDVDALQIVDAGSPYFDTIVSHCRDQVSTRRTTPTGNPGHRPKLVMLSRRPQSGAGSGSRSNRYTRSSDATTTPPVGSKATPTRDGAATTCSASSTPRMR